MSGKTEKRMIEQMQAEYARKVQEIADTKFPMGRAEFMCLFEFLEEQVAEHECDNEMRFTKAWLEVNDPGNADAILKWLGDHGGYCDCEVLMNVTRYFR